MALIEHLDPNQIIFIQARADLNQEVIGDYYALMQDGVVFEPASGVQDETGQVYVWDGQHRGEAARRAGLLLAVKVEPGSETQARWLALTANQKHGLRRSRADKQQAVKQALLHPNGAQLSNREIAQHCGVDHKTVGRIRSDMEAAGEIPRVTERVITTAAGLTYRQDVTKLNQFAPVETLAQALRAALASGELADNIQRLVAIKHQTPQGQAHLAALADHLPTLYRPRDLLAACQTVLTTLRSQVRQTFEGQCPYCQQAVYYARDLGHLFCSGCDRTWNYTNEFNADASAASIEGILKTTLLDANPAAWLRARQQGLSDTQLRDKIARQWGRGATAANSFGLSYRTVGLPSPRLWVGPNITAEMSPTLAGEELLSTVRAALGIPYDGPEGRYCRRCGSRHELPAEQADARHPSPCPQCGGSEAGLWLKNPPPLAAETPPQPAANGQHSYVLAEDQPQPCPRCGQPRVRGVNGSQRWCINCGASWPTAETFLAEVAAATNAATLTDRRAALADRFLALLPELSPTQIGHLEAMLAQLTQEMTWTT